MPAVTNANRSLVIGVALLLGLWLVRLPGLGAFPPFIDEGVHIWFGERSLQTSPLAYAAEGRLFTIWWLLLFQPHLAASVWVARAAVVLAVMPGAAAVLAIGRLGGSTWGMICAGLLYLLSAYHHFYDRLALADPLAAAGVLLAVYFAYRLSRRAAAADAALTGVSLFLAVGAKVSALPYLVVPVLAAFTLRPPHAAVRDRLRWLAVASGVAVGLTGAFALGLGLLGYNPFVLIGAHNPHAAAGLLTRTLTNTVEITAVLAVYTGAAVFALLVLAVTGLLRRARTVFFGLCCALPALVLLVSERQSTRFYLTPMSLLLLCGALALAQLTSRRGLRGLALVLIGAWGVLQWLPFTRTADYTVLPARDYAEYVASDASGFGLNAARQALRDAGARRVIGLLANCQGLRYLALADFPVDCPRVNPNGEDIPYHRELLEQNRAAGTFAVLEAIPYVPDSAPGRQMAVISRPGGGPALTLYDLAP